MYSKSKITTGGGVGLKRFLRRKLLSKVGDKVEGKR